MRTYNELIEIFNDYLNSQNINKHPQELYDPVNYIMDLGGKRIRPIVLLMAYGLMDKDEKEALPLAYAIEMFHNFTLLHDDIMDDADIRRGKETVHVKYGQSAGILSGDVMLILAYKYLAEFGKPELFESIFKVFTDTAIGICDGQQMDINFETSDEVAIEEYLKMIELKTSILLAASMEIGGIAAGFDTSDQHHLFEFGKNVGIAFQIQDDILDTFGNQKNFGKRIGGDILQNKKTYLFLKTKELSSEEDRNRLLILYSDIEVDDEDVKISEVKSLFKRVNVKEYAEQLKMAYSDLATSHLDALNVDESKKLGFRNLTDKLLNRAS